MNENKYKRKFEIQQKKIFYQEKQIEDLKSQIEKLNIDIEEKSAIINSIELLKNEMVKSVSNIKKYEVEYRELIQELRKMKEVMNQEVFKGRWKLIKLLIK